MWPKWPGQVSTGFRQVAHVAWWIVPSRVSLIPPPRGMFRSISAVRVTSHTYIRLDSSVLRSPHWTATMSDGVVEGGVVLGDVFAEVVHLAGAAALLGRDIGAAE